MVIPQSMSYANIAGRSLFYSSQTSLQCLLLLGLPYIYGMYAAFSPQLLHVLAGEVVRMS